MSDETSNPQGPLHYMGVAPVRMEAGGPKFRRDELRYAPEFGATEDAMAGHQENTMDNVYAAYDNAPAGMTLEEDPTGLTNYPNTEGFMKRWDFVSDDLTVDSEAALNADVDIYDDGQGYDEYMTFLAGVNAGEGFSGDELGNYLVNTRAGHFFSPYQTREGAPQIPGVTPHFGDEMGAPVGNEGFPPMGPRNFMQPRKQPKWQKTLLTAITTNTATVGAGTAIVDLNQTITIRPQFDFVAQDLTFAPNRVLGAAPPAAGVGINFANITAVLFGDQVVWNNAVGVPIQLMGSGGPVPNSFIRGLIKGAKLRGGLDISFTLNWQVESVAPWGGGPNPVQITATVVGLKPQTTC